MKSHSRGEMIAKDWLWVGVPETQLKVGEKAMRDELAKEIDRAIRISCAKAWDQGWNTHAARFDVPGISTDNPYQKIVKAKT